MKRLYYVETGNEHGQILVFSSRRRAENWLIVATDWKPDKIKSAVHRIEPDWSGKCSIFPSVPA
jgi:hypothetical protein